MKFGLIPLCDHGTIDDPDWSRDFVQMLEQEQVESVWMPEHVVMAQDYEPLYDYSADGRAPVAEGTVMPDPLHWLSFAGAHTEKLLLGTGVLIGPQHSAAVLAKRLSTMDRLSKGRLRIGVGIGWQKEEYEAVGVQYRQRGKRLDELLDGMRALWRDDPATFNGEFVNFNKVFCDTKPVQAGGVPLYIGGSSEAAAKRAGLRGDGFFPYVISPDDVALRVEQAKAAAEQVGRTLGDDFSITVWPFSFDNQGTFDVGLIKAYQDAGVDRLICASFEAGADTSMQGLRQFVKRYQDEVIGAL